MNVERLNILADFLDTVPTGKFKLANWASQQFFEAGGDVLTLPDCGTTACAVGWGAQDPILKKMGLRLVCNDAYDVGIEYGALDDWDAVESFFGLNANQADHLFSDSEYEDDACGAKDVAARIREFVARDGRWVVNSD